jgi:predicted  nucleic acid-binding Zn-ribbon protein
LQSEPTLQSKIATINIEIAKLTQQREHLQQRVDNLPNKVRNAKVTHLAKVADLSQFYQQWEQTKTTSEQPTTEGHASSDRICRY